MTLCYMDKVLKNDFYEFKHKTYDKAECSLKLFDQQESD